jgi:probable F420-dependent oxidoreductase
MELGLFGVNYGTCGDPEAAIRVVQHAEAAGLESVWTGEHFVLPSPPRAGFSIAPSMPFLDTIVTLTFLAANTTKITLASGILELPLHHPVALAKQLASIDRLSSGRLIVGVGAGYLEEEFAALGARLSERGRRMDEHLDALPALWTMPEPEYHGRHVEFAGIDAHPRPLRADGPPIVVGGVSAGARRRAITKADGWYVFGTDQARAGEAIDVIRADLACYARPTDLGPLEITMTPVGPFDRGVLEWYADLGVHRLVMLQRPDAPADRRHDPVPLDDILRSIDTLAAMRPG